MENWLQRGRRLGRTDQEDPDDPPCTGSSGSSVNFEPNIMRQKLLKNLPVVT